MSDLFDIEDLHEHNKHEVFSQMLEFQTVHPYFSPDATEHEKNFMLRKVNENVLKYATMMHVVAPKTCDKCDADLKIPELCWREEHNVSNFLCYKCIGVLEKEGATLRRDGIGRLGLKELQKDLKI
jgi:hypothetical protein